MARITNPKIFMLLPVFNRIEFTKKCLSSVAKQTYKNYEVILIDDGSTDGTFEFVKNKYPEVKIIRGDGNWWWTKCMYEGVKYALTKAKNMDFVLEMNNDCFFGPNYFKNILSAAKKFPHTLIGSLNVRANKPEEVVEAGVRIDWATGLVYGVAQTITNKLSYFQRMSKVDNLDALPGKGTLIPVNVFKKIGNFNHKLLPHYIADYEFANRAKKNGYELIVFTTDFIKHHFEATGIYSRASYEHMSYLRAFSLLFGRRSMNNIVDWLIFLFLACPRKYLARNLYYTTLKLIKAVLSVFPFYYLVGPLKFVFKIYNHTKLLIYRIVLMIKQYPEYHRKK